MKTICIFHEDSVLTADCLYLESSLTDVGLFESAEEHRGKAISVIYGHVDFSAWYQCPLQS